MNIDPLSLYGDAYNELTFIYGKIKRNLDVAEEYAQKAVECDLQEPKTHPQAKKVAGGMSPMAYKRNIGLAA